ncbi:Hypothetical_protein [Hexamita inflata]|uniref:Hypothetical_protein n=1 Tax=Hexamita inflata TaxID=28002 RepID=A0ABP1H8E3_9EUKA
MLPMAMILPIIVVIAGIIGMLFCIDTLTYYSVFNKSKLSLEQKLGVMSYQTVKEAVHKSKLFKINYKNISKYVYQNSNGASCIAFHEPQILKYQRYFYVSDSEHCYGVEDYTQILSEVNYSSTNTGMYVGIGLLSAVIVGSLIYIGFTYKKYNGKHEEAERTALLD